MNTRLAYIMLAWGELLIPAYLVYRFANANVASLLELLLAAAGLFACCAMLYLVGRWDWFGVWLRHAFLLAPAVTIAVKLSEYHPLAWMPDEPRWSQLAFDSMILIVSCVLTTRALSGQVHGDALQLDVAFPFASGDYYISHGGNDWSINWHAIDETQKHAVDIVKLGPLGTRAAGIYPSHIDRYTIWKETVRCPVDGTVVSVVDGIPDEAPPHFDQVHPAGNHIVLRTDSRPDCYIVLSHLCRASVKVRPGEVVRQGRVLGAVGSSGSISEPHLHIHCACLLGETNDAPSALDLSKVGKGVPLIFSGRYLVRNSLVSVQQPELVEVDQLATSTA